MKAIKTILLVTFFAAIILAQEASKDCGPLLKDFKAKLETPEFKEKIQNLKQRVENFAIGFPMPGYDDW